MEISDLLKEEHSAKWYVSAEVNNILWQIAWRLGRAAEQGNWDGPEELATALIEAGIPRIEEQL